MIVTTWGGRYVHYLEKQLTLAAMEIQEQSKDDPELTQV